MDKGNGPHLVGDTIGGREDVALDISAAAVLVPAGFFLPVAGKNVSEPAQLIALLYADGASPVIGVVSRGVDLRAA